MPLAVDAVSPVEHFQCYIFALITCAFGVGVDPKLTEAFNEINYLMFSNWQAVISGVLQ